jgi:hypothetical protein
VESVLNIDEVSFETLGLLLWTWNNKKVVPNCLLGGEKEFWAEVTYFQDMREPNLVSCLSPISKPRHANSTVEIYTDGEAHYPIK